MRLPVCVCLCVPCACSCVCPVYVYVYVYAPCRPHLTLDEVLGLLVAAAVESVDMPEPCPHTRLEDDPLVFTYGSEAYLAAVMARRRAQREVEIAVAEAAAGVLRWVQAAVACCCVVGLGWGLIVRAVSFACAALVALARRQLLGPPR